jgi:hypothetical protein
VRNIRTIRRILVAIKNPRALPSISLIKAAQIAQACGAEMDLFHDISTPVFVSFRLDSVIRCLRLTHSK